APQPAVRIAQRPSIANDRWLALPPEPGGTAVNGRLAMGAHLAGAVSAPGAAARRVPRSGDGLGRGEHTGGPRRDAGPRQGAHRRPRLGRPRRTGAAGAVLPVQPRTGHRFDGALAGPGAQRDLTRRAAEGELSDDLGDRLDPARAPSARRLDAARPWA